MAIVHPLQPVIHYSSAACMPSQAFHRLAKAGGFHTEAALLSTQVQPPLPASNPSWTRKHTPTHNAEVEVQPTSHVLRTAYVNL